MFWPAFSDHLSIGVFMAALVEKYGIEETEDAIKKIPPSKFMNIFSPMQNENFLKDIFNLNKDTQEYLDSRGLSIALRSLGFVFSKVSVHKLARRLTGVWKCFWF